MTPEAAPRLPHCQLCGLAPANWEHALETQRRWGALTSRPDRDGLPEVPEAEAAAGPDLVIDNTRYALAECNRVHVDEAAAGTALDARLSKTSALADALHHVMCEVSHHDRDFRERLCYAKYPLIARSAVARLAGEEK